MFESDSYQYYLACFAIGGFHGAASPKAVLGQEKLILSLGIGVGPRFLCEPGNAAGAGSQKSVGHFISAIGAVHESTLLFSGPSFGGSGI